MDIKQLRYFYTIAEEGHITGAAKKLFMSQPSLSQQLKLLETELDTKLVERGRRGVTLTEAGRFLRERAEQILDLLHSTALEVKELDEGHKGTLAIGTIASAGVTLLPSLILHFHEQYPKIKFQLWEGDTNRIIELLNNGVVELGIVRSVFDFESYYWVNLPPDQMIVAMSRPEKKERNKRRIFMNELAGKPLLLHRSNEMMIIECCRRFGFEPQVLCCGDDIRSLLVLANKGIGLAIVPKSALGLIHSNNLKYMEIVDSPLKIKKAVIWRKQGYLSAVARHFLKAMFPDITIKKTT